MGTMFSNLLLPPAVPEVVSEWSVKALPASPCPKSATGDRRREKDVMNHDTEELPRPPVKTDNPSRQESSETLLNGRTGRFSPAGPERGAPCSRPSSAFIPPWPQGRADLERPYPAELLQYSFMGTRRSLQHLGLRLTDERQSQRASAKADGALYLSPSARTSWRCGRRRGSALW